MALAQSDIYTLARSVGLTDSRAKVAAAIAMAESGGDPNNHNTKPPDDSYGLWQINMLGSMGPTRRQQFGITANTDLYNPQTNAKAMKALSQDGGNFNAWTTYTTTDPKKSYRQFMANTVTDQSSSPGWLERLGGAFAPFGVNLLAPTGINPLQSLGQAVDAINKTSKWVSNSQNWVRVGFITGGIVVTVAGLVMVMESTKAGRAATGLVAGMTPTGRVASVATAAKKGAS